MVLTWRVASNLPIIGYKVERLFADLIRTSLEADHAFTLHYLEAHGHSCRRAGAQAQGNVHAEVGDKQRTDAKLLTHPPFLEWLREQGQVRASTFP